ncbi:MAG: glycosyltransferase family 2 protein [bacterium]
MPVYNGEKFIREALDSLLAQTFTDFELIISDNASTDRTGMICREYGKNDKRIRYFRQPENKGALFNFNFVLKQADGQYFMWAAHDDKWDSNWIEKALINFRENAAVSFGHVMSINTDGKVVRTYKYYPFSKNKTLRLIQFFLRQEAYGKANVFYGIYNLSFLKAHQNKLSSQDTYFVDMHFIFDLAQYGEIITDQSIKLYKRIKDTESKIMRKSGSVEMFKTLFLIDYIKYYSFYITIPKNLILKVIILILFPIKYLFSITYSWTKIFKSLLFYPQ